MILNPSRRKGQHGPEGEGQTLGSTIDPDVRVRPLGRREPEGLSISDP